MSHLDLGRIQYLLQKHTGILLTNSHNHYLEFIQLQKKTNQCHVFVFFALNILSWHAITFGALAFLHMTSD